MTSLLYDQEKVNTQKTFGYRTGGNRCGPFRLPALSSAVSEVAGAAAEHYFNQMSNVELPADHMSRQKTR